MKLGVLHHEMEAIDNEKKNSAEKLMKMLSEWLRAGGKDGPLPSWSTLYNAVQALDRNIADAIARDHPACKCHDCLGMSHFMYADE